MTRTPSKLKPPRSIDPVHLPESLLKLSVPSAQETQSRKEEEPKSTRNNSGLGKKRALSPNPHHQNENNASSANKRVMLKASSSRPGASKTAATTKSTTTSITVKKTAAPAKETFTRNSSNVAGSDASGSKKRRPAWDTKGRLQDMEEITQSLKTQIQTSSVNVNQLSSKLEESESRVQQLENFRSALENKVVLKEQEAGSLSIKIQELNFELTLKERESQSVKEELERKSKNWKNERQELEGKISVLLMDKQNLEMAISKQGSTLIMVETEVKNLREKIAALETLENNQKHNIFELIQSNEEKDKEIAQLREKIQNDEMLRRKLHNEIQELKGNIRVFCRVRPILEAEYGGMDREELMKHLNFPDLNSSTDVPKSIELLQTVESVVPGGTSTIPNETTKTIPFSFDRVFGPTSTQQDVFSEISQLVQSALDGYRVCIFAYGQTNSGKSYTMEGPSISSPEDPNLGMIPRAMFLVFDSIKGKLAEKGWNYNFEVSYLEIYNETIRDLLAPHSDDHKKHEIKHSRDGCQNTTVTDLTLTTVKDPSQVFDLLGQARKNRSVGETQCNERSSRSHSVFTMKLIGENTVTGEKSEGLLNLIDLAGSERLSASGSMGERLKETQHINKSLSALGDVIFALANKEPHIPYRNSKLTYLLQNSLGGNSKTLMFVNVSPLASQWQETLCSLRFATKVNRCQIGTARLVVSRK